MSQSILITGKNGYIGSSLAAFLEKTGVESGDGSDRLQSNRQCSDSTFNVSRLDFRAPFTEKSFEGFDTVIHAAAVVHKREKRESFNEYIEINTERSFELAQKCKNAGAGHFIFLSTMAVFEGCTLIERGSAPKPVSFYGKSKLLAEQKISELADARFRISIIRPPMVYGKNCPGNFHRLAEFCGYTPVFPLCENRRSMIYIEHLLSFLKIITEQKETGIFHPQNKEYVCTSNLVKLIRKRHGKKTLLLPGFAFLRRLNIPVVKKLFSDMAYSCDMDDFDYSYCTKTFAETVFLSF